MRFTQGRRTVAVIVSLSAWLLLPQRDANAVEFAIVGPRAMGMGGAGVAVTTDALATYWNPAGLAMAPTIDLRVQASAQGIDRLGVLDTVKQINDTNLNDTSPANQAKVQNLVNRINQPGASLSGIGAGGLYFKGYWGSSAFGFNISDVATSGATVSQPVGVANSGGRLNVTGQFALRGLEARQAAFSYAYAFAERTFAIGATAKVIQGAAYTGLMNVLGADNIDNIRDSFGKAKLSTAIGIDVGAVFRPAPWLRLGVVGKDINAPTFDAPDGEQFKLGPQVRGGIAINPDASLTLTFDGDITVNRTLVPGQKSRVFSVGAEQTILADFLAFRLGAWKDVEDAKTSITPTAGFGIRFFGLRVDIGGGYDFRERHALVSGSVAMTF